MMDSEVDYGKQNYGAQLNRIESKLDELLARKKRVVKALGSKYGYPEWFNSLFMAYPRRSGSNPLKKAYEAANKRMSEGDEWGAMEDGVQRYAKFCDATGKTGTEYVMQAATFFGPDRHYECDWTIPAGAIKSKVPKDNEEMQKWAVKRGLRAAYQGESWPQYRAYVEDNVA